MITPSALFPATFLGDDGQNLTWRAYLILILLCLAYFLPGLASLPPIDRDEPHFAQATKQMIETGNYTDIRFQNETRYKKPVGIYWLQAASVKLLSPKALDAIWAYRVPSVIGATIAVVMTAMLGNLMFGPLTGFLGAVLLAACLVLNVEARLAKTDAMLLACIMTAQYGLARAYIMRDEQVRQSWLVCFAFWTAQALGFLIKGPLSLLITLATITGLRLTDKRLGWLSALRPVVGLPYALLLVVPWFVMIMLASKGDFATQSAGHDFLAKLWQGQDRGILPPGLHLLAFPLVFFPGSILALMAIPDVWRQRHDPRVRFCLSWIIPTWIVFELSLTKLPHYVMPVYPAIALLAAHMALKGYPALAERQWRWMKSVAFGLWFLAGIILAGMLAIVPFQIDHALSLSGLTAGAILLATLAVFFMTFKARSPRKYLALIVGSLLFYHLAFGSTIPSMNGLWLSRQIVKAAELVKPCDQLAIVSSAYNEPSLIFLAGTKTKVFYGGHSVAGELKENPCRLGLIERDRAAAFLDSFSETPVKPVEVARFSGFNIGNGKHADLTLYRLPAEPRKP